ncbi:MAG: hypothetical protein VX399_09030, partial [SAR324 cluster bacterium]|nr:hypothetical protein [SAR324 cluster bacterium]
GRISTGRESWARRLIHARNAEEQWLYSTLGAGAGTLLLLSRNFKPFDGLIGTLMPWLVAVGTIYAGMEYMKFRNLVSELTLEGRNQGYLTFQPIIRDQRNDGLRLVWSRRF